MKPAWQILALFLLAASLFAASDAGAGPQIGPVSINPSLPQSGLLLISTVSDIGARVNATGGLDSCAYTLDGATWHNASALADGTCWEGAVDTRAATLVSIRATDAANRTAYGTPVRVQVDAPALSNVSIRSNGANASQVRVGGQVILSFASAQPIQPSVRIDGQNAKVSQANGTWTAVYTLQDGQPQDPVEFSIAYSNRFGAPLTVRSTTDGSVLRFLAPPASAPANGKAVAPGAAQLPASPAPAPASALPQVQISLPSSSRAPDLSVLLGLAGLLFIAAGAYGFLRSRASNPKKKAR